MTVVSILQVGVSCLNFRLGSSEASNILLVEGISNHIRWSTNRIFVPLHGKESSQNLSAAPASEPVIKYLVVLDGVEAASAMQRDTSSRSSSTLK